MLRDAKVITFGVQIDRETDNELFFFPFSKMSNWVCAVVVLAAMVAATSASAIPMWEFLSRGEKVSTNSRLGIVDYGCRGNKGPRFESRREPVV